MTLAARLEVARRREKAQTLFYRALAAAAEEAGAAADSETLNELHADEQHHLSRLTARLLETGARPADLDDVDAGTLPGLEVWRDVAREREDAEVRFYEEALASNELDEATRGVLEEILWTERQHREHLGGKWTPA
jgi:rubrerythrin